VVPWRWRAARPRSIDDVELLAGQCRWRIPDAVEGEGAVIEWRSLQDIEA